MNAAKLSNPTLENLLRIIEEMPEEKQLALLQQLLQGRVKPMLRRLIHEMPNEDRLVLLNQLGGTPIEEMPAKTIFLDEEKTAMRGQLRKPCHLPVTFVFEQWHYYGHIRDISTLGVFIVTEEPFPIGSEMNIYFSLPDSQEDMEISGQVAWGNPHGIGLKFTGLKREQEERIKAFIGAEENP
jgi:Tfp pilus assembly protein PilZ